MNPPRAAVARPHMPVATEHEETHVWVCGGVGKRAVIALKSAGEFSINKILRIPQAR
jgi:hypothetical protein